MARRRARLGPRAGVARTAVFLLCVACAHRREPPQDEAVASEATPGAVEIGYATWYGGRLAGHRTASGERFDPREMTAAHRTLPFGTWVDVRRLDTGNAVRVRITDRGPFGHEERIIDLSREAARRLGMMKAGVVRVEVRVLYAP